jgi:hypothetical protein
LVGIPAVPPFFRGLFGEDDLYPEFYFVPVEIQAKAGEALGPAI